MKRIIKVLINYRFKRVAQYSGFAHDVVTSLTSSTYLTNASALVDIINTPLKALDTFAESNPRGNSFVTAELEVLRENLMVALGKVANDINNLLAGNEAGLLSTGFELTKEPRKRAAPLAARSCEIVDGTTTGSMCIRVKRAPGTMNIKWYYTTDLTLHISQWTELLELTDELTLTGLTPGTKLYVRVACINSASTTANLVFVEAKARYVQ